MAAQPLIEKKIIYGGKGNANFQNGTKIFFHFQTRKCDEARTLIDDSKKIGPGNPLELVLGKKFKLECWEAMLQKMAVNEVAQFTVDKSLVMEYPFVSKTLRDAYSCKQHRSSCCAMLMQTEGVGYDDLNDILRNPVNLEFTMELLKVEQPGDYEKDVWQMNEEEKLNSVPNLKEMGNEMFKKKDYDNASKLYSKAIGMLEQLMLREKPHDVEWTKLNNQKLPLLLNFSQCKLNEGDFYAAIEHCTTVLESDPNNIKALFRRGKAHIGAWNPTEARNDLLKAAELDPKLTAVVKKELQILDEELKKRDIEDKEKFKNMFST